MNTEISPGHVLDKNDPGDEILARFRYQCCAAAINCVRLITEPNDVAAVFCENFEDILIELADGKFVGQQIKTRQLDLSPFKATDEVVRKALGRFCKLDALFPDKFCQFDFSTNHRFWIDAENERNLPWCLTDIKVRNTVKHLPRTNPMRKLVDALCEHTQLNAEQVVGTLCKTTANARTEPVDAIDFRVIAAVGECQTTAQLTFSQNAKIAEELIYKTSHASAKKIKGPTTDLYAAGTDFSEVLKCQILAGKRLSKQDVEAIIQSQMVTSEPLDLAGLVPIGNLPTNLAVMIQKLDRGGLQAVRIEGIGDLVKSFEYLLIKWVNKYGGDVAEERYKTLLTKVKYDCIEAQVAAETPDEPYAPQMYALLVERLKSRVADAHDELHGCSTEHLIGAAGMLTHQCKAWWSPKFEIQDPS